jgi:hypothetical protein
MFSVEAFENTIGKFVAITTHRSAKLLAGHRGGFRESGLGAEGDGGGVSQSLVWGGCPATGILTRFRPVTRYASSFEAIASKIGVFLVVC